MHRFLLFVLLSLVPVFCWGQSRISDADRLYEQGDYEQAQLIYVQYKDNSVKAAKRYDECVNLDTYYKVALESFDKKSYQKAAKVCDMILNVNPKDPKAIALKGKCDDAVNQLRQERDSLLEKARVECSVELIAKFKSKYKLQVNQLAKADSILADIPLWQDAVKKNTKASYQEYLAKTSYNRYQSDAEYRVGKFECEEMWKRIVANRNIADFEQFLQMYEKYDLHNDEAKANIDLLTGVGYSSRNSHAKAFRYYDSAYKSGKVKFLDTDLEAYELSKDYFAYENAKSEEDILKYMADYKDGVNYKLASSKLCCLRADKLTEHSTRSERRAVKSLAKTAASKEYVDNVFRDLKKERRETKRLLYGRRITYGIGADFDVQSEICSWSVGAWAKLGRFVDFGSIALGVGYREYNSMHLPDDNRLGSHLFGGQVIVPVEVKFNVIPLTDGAKIYIGCGTEYGFAVRDSKYFEDDSSYGSQKNFDANILEKSTINYYPMIGISSRYVDCSLYYKRFGKNLFKDDGYISEEFVDAKDFFGIKLNCYF